MTRKRTTSTVKGVLTVADRAHEEVEKLDDARRKLLADWCKLVDSRLKGQSPTIGQTNGKHDPLAGIKLSPRMKEILELLLKGDSEKQIALHLKISMHTVHTHVKKLHKTLGVSSRGELLAKFVSRKA